MLTSVLLLIHLASFAAYLGAGFAQFSLMKGSLAPGLSPDVRADRENLAASVVTKIELPAIMGSILTGAAFIIMTPALMKLGWLHGKLLCVLLLAGISHAAMFNARAIVKARRAGGDAAADEIAARKKRHLLFGRVGGALVAVVLVLVTIVRLGG